MAKWNIFLFNRGAAGYEDLGASNTSIKTSLEFPPGYRIIHMNNWRISSLLIKTGNLLGDKEASYSTKGGFLQRQCTNARCIEVCPRNAAERKQWAQRLTFCRLLERCSWFLVMEIGFSDEESEKKVRGLSVNNYEERYRYCRGKIKEKPCKKSINNYGLRIQQFLLAPRR